MTYSMKDLGYKRTPTNAACRVTMPDGSRWDVPAQVIADDRDEYYEEENEDTIGFIRTGAIGKSEIRYWAGNNMNWSEVVAWAVLAPVVGTRKVDYEEGWVNGEKEIIGEV